MGIQCPYFCKPALAETSMLFEFGHSNFVLQFHFLRLKFCFLNFTATTGLSKKMTCLPGLEASKPRSHKAETNFGFMSTIIYDGALRPKLLFFDKMRNTEYIDGSRAVCRVGLS